MNLTHTMLSSLPSASPLSFRSHKIRQPSVYLPTPPTVDGLSLLLKFEEYPIIKACIQLEFLLARSRGFRLFCDHANLIHIFSLGQSVKRHIRGKLQRWALHLVPYRYEIEHLSDERNVFADIVSRWIAPPQPVNATAYAMRLRSELQLSPLCPLQTPGFVYPSVKEIVTHQQRSSSRPGPLPADGSPILVEGKVWLPPDADHLIMRVFIVAHCAVREHRGVHVMVNIIKREFMVDNLQRRVQAFVKKCLLCRHVKGQLIVQRDWSTADVATKRNETLLMDYLYLGDSISVLGSQLTQLSVGTSALVCRFSFSVESLGNKCPMEIFTDLPPPPLLASFIAPDGDSTTAITVNNDSLAQQLNQLTTRLQQMHKVVESSKRDRQQVARDASSGAAANFEVGDFVLWSRVDPRLSGSKLIVSWVSWVGLFVVTGIKEHCFEAENLITKARNDVHGSRLKLYSKTALEVTEELREHISTQGLVLGVREICDLRYNNSAFAWELKVAWVGLEHAEASWEPISSINADVPGLVSASLDAHPSSFDVIRLQHELQ
ncbi:unnamed protein product [Peronospora destructor]|uniref:Chromo domain-containing protein n=1 Tax=Peronospora destructor TaxID=86335 RepID=A0AAV0VDY7_9STRA|nr:unnamed protein product [Peronospora destructor]